MSHTLIPYGMLNEHILSTVKKSSGKKKNWLKNYRPVMKGLQHSKSFWTSFITISQEVSSCSLTSICFPPVTGCLDDITALIETVIYYTLKRSYVYCAIGNFSKVCDRVNTSWFCDKMKETDLSSHIIALIDVMCKNAFVRTSYGWQLSDEWNGNDVRQRGISFGIFF